MEEMFLNCLLVLKYGGILSIGGAALSIIVGEKSKQNKVDRFSEVKLGMNYKEVKEIIGLEGQLVEESENKGVIKRTYIWYLGWHTNSKNVGKSYYTVNQNGRFLSSSGDSHTRTNYNDRSYISVVFYNGKVQHKGQKGLGL